MSVPGDPPVPVQAGRRPGHGGDRVATLVPPALVALDRVNGAAMISI